MESSLQSAQPEVISGLLQPRKAAGALSLEELLMQLVMQLETHATAHKRSAPDEAEQMLDVQVWGRRYAILVRPMDDETSSGPSLSPREREIVRLVAHGLPNKAIATMLEISQWTVATHVRRIFAKLEVSSRAEMVAKALHDGLLSDDSGAPPAYGVWPDDCHQK